MKNIIQKITVLALLAALFVQPADAMMNQFGDSWKKVIKDNVNLKKLGIGAGIVGVLGAGYTAYSYYQFKLDQEQREQERLKKEKIQELEKKLKNKKRDQEEILKELQKEQLQKIEEKNKEKCKTTVYNFCDSNIVAQFKEQLFPLWLQGQRDYVKNSLTLQEQKYRFDNTLYHSKPNASLFGVVNGKVVSLMIVNKSEMRFVNTPYSCKVISSSLSDARKLINAVTIKRNNIIIIKQEDESYKMLDEHKQYKDFAAFKFVITFQKTK